MKKILYTTDFSKNAETAFPVALEMAEKHGAELHLLHVFDIPTSWNYPYAGDPLEMESQAIEDAEKKLKAIVDSHASNTTKKFIIRYHTLENPSVVEGVLSCVRQINPDLLVIGTKGGSKTREIIVGSTTKSLLSKSTVPVLAIPEGTEYTGFQQVLYASDLLESDLLALEQLIHLLQPYQPSILLVHISSQDAHVAKKKIEWFQELLRERISYENLKIIHFLSESVAEGLDSLISQNQFDLLVMLEKERHGITDLLFHQDLVKKMEFRTRIPILSFNQLYTN